MLACCNCGAPVLEPAYFETFTPENKERFAQRVACDRCTPIVEAKREAEREEEERKADLRELQRKLDERYAERIRDSQLDLYELEFDPANPAANNGLARWMFGHVDSCVWIIGESGKCKTRVIQAAAREACKNRTVRYWPVLDLAARLTETAKHPEAQLKDTYFAELLILDDLGKEPLTAARLASLAAIVDRRYIGWDQVRRKQGAEHPVFGLGAHSDGKLGGQIWITSQVEPDAIAEKLSAVDQNDATAIVRRLAEMCVLHRA